MSAVADQTSTARPIVSITKGTAASDGAGVKLRRMIGGPGQASIDPFLMLDFFSSDEPSDYLGGFPDHPHRGFETVTYMLAGRMRHGDNKGHSGVIEAGGVQWMTAGRGLVHSEMPEQEHGLLQGFQLWVNLPARLKMTDPRYAEFPVSAIPTDTRPGALIKVVAGRTSSGVEGPVKAEHVDARYFDIALEPGAEFAEPLPRDHSGLLVVFEGSLEVEGKTVDALSVAVLGPGDRLAAKAGPKGARFLLIAGRPLQEPVAWYGPFVMNTEAELHQAVRDYQAGRF
jgi:redox-sensitive bicupin YhaK (pirin superfamily)